MNTKNLVITLSSLAIIIAFTLNTSTKRELAQQKTIKWSELKRWKSSKITQTKRKKRKLRKRSAKSNSMLAKAWGLGGQYGVNAESAQRQLRKSCRNSGVVVAVIDTGLDIKHPELKNSLWKNTREIANNGLDDDGNGLVDDVHGWDYSSNSGRIIDKNGHGTHIAGIIAASGKGKIGLKGVCPGVKIMSLRYYNQYASGMKNLNNSIKAFEYAIKMGANIINYSGGGTEHSKKEKLVIKEAKRRGILVVAAAGNERSNADQSKYYPASYKLGQNSNIISVTAINKNGKVLPSSNWGKRNVHVAAPGNNILSTVPHGGYGFLTGTSQATAFVSGIAALLMVQKKGISYKEVKRIIEASAVRYPQLAGKASSSGAANASKALRMLKKSRRLSSKYR